MKKRIVLSLAAVGTAIAMVPLFAAFEAHVINVTAKIENALSVNADPIEFGTVFPQEELDADIHVLLSESFIEEDRVDDVDYIIRQKPKCGWTLEDGTNLLGIPTKTGHVDDNGVITCPDPGNPLRPQGSSYGQLPLLCPYLSKHKDPADVEEGDFELDAFHQIGATSTEGWVWNDASGHLSKDDQDTEDWWIIDLKVPCFGDHCAQDWDDFVFSHNEGANPDDFIQPIENEHKIFGCDLWIEVTGVSTSTRTE